MNPLSALIGGVSSLLGGFMNTSSAQAINSQNIQAQEGATYLNYNLSQQAQRNAIPNLVAGANAAGINPLAALGVSSAGFSGSTGGGSRPTDPGAGLQDFGKILASVDPHVEKMRALESEKASVEIANARLAGDNAAIQVARDAWISQAMREWYAGHPDAPPPGSSGSSVPDLTQSELNSFKDRFDAMGAGINSLMARIPSWSWNTP